MLRSTRARPATTSTKPIAIASSATCSSSEASSSEASAWIRVLETSAWKAPNLARRASNSVFPARMSGLTTGFPAAWICLIVGSA